MAPVCNDAIPLQVVCMYPSILDPRASATDGGSTSMVDHFVAYVRGAGMLEGVRGPALLL